MKRSVRTVVIALAAWVAWAPGTARAVVIESISLVTHDLPGDRETSAVVNLEGRSRADVSAWVHYSTTREALNTIGSALPHGRASARLVNGKLACSFIFPHTSHPTPNILTQTEIGGGEPPATRPTYVDLAVASATGSTRFVATDVNPMRINSPSTGYCRWVVKVRTGTATQTIQSAIREFKMPRRMVFALIGDSYSAGEGAPNIVGSTDQQRWDDTYCHRSERSGQMRAVKEFRITTPEIATAVFNATCSGAEIDKGLLLPQEDLPGELAIAEGNLPDAVKPPQIRQLEDWMAANGRNKVDFLIMSAGGNNLGFGDAVVACLFGFMSNCGEKAELRARITTRAAALPAAYDLLQSRLSQLNIGQILITEYPNPLQAPSGRLCNTPGDPDPGYGGIVGAGCWGVLERQLSIGDVQWVHDSLLVVLNRNVAAAAQKNGWTYVGGVQTESAGHGICNCSEPYFNTFGQALGVQGDVLGMLHPNRTGHRETYQPRVKRVLALEIAKLKARATALEKLRAASGTTATEDMTPFIKSAVAPTAVSLTLQRLRLAMQKLPRYTQLSTTSITAAKITATSLDAIDREKIVADRDGR